MSKRRRSPRVRQTSAESDSTTQTDNQGFAGLSVSQTVVLSGLASGLAAGATNWTFDQFIKAPEVAVKKVTGGSDG